MHLSVTRQMAIGLSIGLIALGTINLLTGSAQATPVDGPQATANLLPVDATSIATAPLVPLDETTAAPQKRGINFLSLSLIHI